MNHSIHFGNAHDQKDEFGGWVVGAIQQWKEKKQLPFDPNQYGIRNTEKLEIRFLSFGKDDVRPKWAPCSNKAAILFLVKGRYVLRFRRPLAPADESERALEREGDFVTWREDIVEHIWKASAGSTVVVVRWPI